MKSFNNTFKQVETNQFHNTRSIVTHQLLKRHDFKTEKYSCVSILNKCLSWNLLQNVLKTNFKKVELSEIKTLLTNHLLDKYTK